MPPTEELRRDRETARLRRGLPPLPRPSLASRVAASLKKSPLGVLYNKMTHRRTVRILCLGDSLTAGYSQLGTVYHPYEDSMVKMLKKKFTDVDFDTVEDGVPGDRVRGGSFLGRMTEHWATDSYDWTIVLGGTNDLAWFHDSDALFAALKAVWEIPLSNGGNVLALTVPEIGQKGNSASLKRLTEAKNKLNDLIKGYKRENFHVLDFHAAMPFHALSKQEQREFWDDAIHLTAEGYDRMGEKIAEALIPIMEREEKERIEEEKKRIEKEKERIEKEKAEKNIGKERVSENNRGAKKRKRQFRDDDKDFSEEEGNPTAINQGYVVVRRQDLD